VENSPNEPKEFNATESAIRLAEEHGIDLAEVEGTGPNGRIFLRDVEALEDA
jgi:pyruvate/2-oxoglutarate dehydrogenase complex dihydrolipoamide acyltransferase (E2) component